MNRRQNAEQMLGVASNASPEDISRAFQARVSELTQMQTSPNEFQNRLNHLYSAQNLLSQPTRSGLYGLESPLDLGYYDNFMKGMHNQMRREMDNLFDQQYRHSFNLHQQLANQQQSTQITEPQVQHSEDIQDMQHPESYKYSRSFSKSIKVDHNGNVIGSSNKVIHNNDKVFREEKEFDSSKNNVHVKRYRPDGSVKEFDKPFPNKLGQKYLN
jgi:hypothetical protein